MRTLILIFLGKEIMLLPSDKKLYCFQRCLMLFFVCLNAYCLKRKLVNDSFFSRLVPVSILEVLYDTYREGYRKW